MDFFFFQFWAENTVSSCALQPEFFFFTFTIFEVQINNSIKPEQKGLHEAITLQQKYCLKNRQKQVSKVK